MVNRVDFCSFFFMVARSKRGTAHLAPSSASPLAYLTSSVYTGGLSLELDPLGNHCTLKAGVGELSTF